MVHFSLALVPAELALLRAESYDMDEFPAQGWPATITAFRRDLLERPGGLLLISVMLHLRTAGSSSWANSAAG